MDAKPTKFDRNRQQANEAAGAGLLDVRNLTAFVCVARAQVMGIGQGCLLYQSTEEIPRKTSS
jgi:hypothetical protein